MDRTIGPLDYWTIGLFLGLFFRQSFGQFFRTFHFFLTILSGDSRPLVLKEGWEIDCCYSGRGERWLY